MVRVRFIGLPQAGHRCFRRIWLSPPMVELMALKANRAVTVVTFARFLAGLDRVKTQQLPVAHLAVNDDLRLGIFEWPLDRFARPEACVAQSRESIWAKLLRMGPRGGECHAD
jgi:hypothetical protein